MSSDFVDLSRWSFAFWWLVILAMHLVTCGYNAVYAFAYWSFEYTYIYDCLAYVRIGMPAKDHPTIVAMNLIMSVMHGVCVLLMVGGSLLHRQLAFSPWIQDTSANIKASKGNEATEMTHQRSDGLCFANVRTQITRSYYKVWDRRGLLGVNGANFHLILITRQLVGTTLQTAQAYRISWFLPQMVLNHFYLSLLVLNCWSSVLVYSLLRLRGEAHRRFVCQMLGCASDIISFIGVPLLVVRSYVDEYNWDIAGFVIEKWYDDEWAARMLNEVQMVIVISWSDLFSRTIFSLGVIVTTTSLKELLRRAPDNTKHNLNSIAVRAKVSPKNDKINNVKKTTSTAVVTVPKTGPDSSYDGIGLHSLVARRMIRLVHLLFGVWGIVVLGLHIQASMKPPLPQCLLQVHPWGISKPACFLAVLDCHSLGISGKMYDVEAKWREFDRATIVTLIIRHCPTLEVPDLFGDFHRVVNIKVYNSTIDNWGDSAAITNTNHPNVLWLYLARVNMTDGVLPAGFQSIDFPFKLQDIEFCYTNLRELPEDLDSKWLVGSIIYIEFSQLTAVQPVLVRLEPYFLGLNGNPIDELPPELFEIPNMMYVGVSDTNIRELPRDVLNLSSGLVSIFMTDTDISFFWSWIDPLVERNLVAGETSLIMGRSNYCVGLKSIMNGEAMTFSELPSAEYSTILMDPSDANRDVMLHAVDCDDMYAASFYSIATDENEVAFYPITIDDANNALT